MITELTQKSEDYKHKFEKLQQQMMVERVRAAATHPRDRHLLTRHGYSLTRRHFVTATATTTHTHTPRSAEGQRTCARHASADDHRRAAGTPAVGSAAGDGGPGREGGAAEGGACGAVVAVRESAVSHGESTVVGEEHAGRGDHVVFPRGPDAAGPPFADRRPQVPAAVYLDGSDRW